jgi:hypothetical protein
MGTIHMKDADGNPEDTCGICRGKSVQEYSYSFDHEYENQHISEGLSHNSKSGYYYEWYD